MLARWLKGDQRLLEDIRIPKGPQNENKRECPEACERKCEKLRVTIPPLATCTSTALPHLVVALWWQQVNSARLPGMPHDDEWP